MTAFKNAYIENRISAAQKDWRLSAKGKKLRDIAKEALKTPIVGTAAEIGERFKAFTEPWTEWTNVADHEPGEKFVWAIHTPEKGGKRHPYIVVVGKIDE